jgi:hypothetical protein
MRKKPFKLTEQRKHELKTATVDYLRGLHSPINELEYALMAPRALAARFRVAGTILLEPESMVSEAHYLHSGLAILYSIDALTGDPKLLYVWEEKTIIVLYEEFKEKLPSGEYYIELIEDSELVSITNFCMDAIYDKHTVAYLLTQKILNMQTKRRFMQTDILLMVDKKLRYCVLKRTFPGLFTDGKCRLSNDQICGFIGIKESTLLEARKVCPDAA